MLELWYTIFLEKSEWIKEPKETIIELRLDCEPNGTLEEIGNANKILFFIVNFITNFQSLMRTYGFIAGEKICLF
jgi:hypothetical protein